MDATTVNRKTVKDVWQKCHTLNGGSNHATRIARLLLIMNDLSEIFGQEIPARVLDQNELAAVMGKTKLSPSCGVDTGVELKLQLNNGKTGASTIVLLLSSTAARVWFPERHEIRLLNEMGQHPGASVFTLLLMGYTNAVCALKAAAAAT
jgi:hypothetical protein